MKKFALLYFLFLTPLFAALPPGIDWHQGTVESAFELASKENRPLFLYWGAVWCPPCNEIKKIVFSDPQFKKEIKKFIPVYLDGDDPRAQFWGNKFKFTGYPNTLIINPTGKEVVRFPNEPSVENYLNLMVSAQKKMDPIEIILKRARAGEAVKSDWELISNFSFRTSNLIDLQEQGPLFKELYFKIPKIYKNARAKLFIKYLFGRIRYLQQNIDPKEKIFFKKELANYLAQTDFIDKNTQSMTWYGVYFLYNLYENEELKKNEKLFFDKMTQIMNDKNRPTNTRLWAMLPWIDREAKMRKTFSKELLAMVKNMANWADKKTTDAYSRQVVVTTILNLLKKTKQQDLAYKYALKETKISNSPFYFMSKLAKIEEERGNKKEALKWHKKAYDSSKGPVTRFSWGNRYMNAMMKIEPQNSKALLKTSLPLLKRVLKQDDAFIGGNDRGFTTFSYYFNQWKTKSNLSPKAVKEVKAQYENLCIDAQNTLKCKEWADKL